MINDRRYDDMNRADFTGKVGEVEEWTVHNRSNMDHLPPARCGVSGAMAANQRPTPAHAETLRAWRDVVNLKPGESLALRCATPAR